MMQIRAGGRFFAYFAHQTNFVDRNNFVSYDKPYIFGIASSMPTWWCYSFFLHTISSFDRIFEIL